MSRSYNLQDTRGLPNAAQVIQDIPFCGLGCGLEEVHETPSVPTLITSCLPGTREKKQSEGHAKPPCNPMVSDCGMGQFGRGSRRNGYGNLHRDEEIACEKIGIEMAERRCNTQFCP